MMRRLNSCRNAAAAISIASLAFLAACGDKSDPVAEIAEPATTQITEVAETSIPASMLPDDAIPEDQFGDDEKLSAVIGASEIPYPVYPNGSKYRVGGENGLKIVLFETTDTFEQVDEFYKGQTSEQQMPRLVAMNDYVRYSSDEKDKDPWATFRPGIVIHKFNDDTERSAVGANQSARTNIIMSF